MTTLTAIIASFLEKEPDKTLIVMEDRQLSYKKFFEQAQNLASHLQHWELQNERVLVHFNNSLESALIYMGCFMAGVVVVPLHVDLKQAEIAYIAQKTEPKALFAADLTHPELSGALALPLSHKLDLSGIAPLFNTKANHKLKAPREEEPLAIFFTSGSTARPKGVVHSQSSFVAMLRTLADGADLGPDHRFLVIESMSNASGCAHVFMAPYVGGTTILCTGQDAEAIIAAMSHQPTHTAIIGKTNYDIASDPSLSPKYFPTMILNFSGGDLITTELMQRFREKTGFPIRLGYGMSEFLIFTVNKSKEKGKLTSVGKVAKGVRIKLLDPRGIPVIPGEIGEVWAQGPNCMLGYWGDPEATAQSIVDGWLRTGDLARQDDDGYFWFMGRIKQIIVREGANIAPLEVEAVLAQHPAIHVAAVVGKKNRLEGEVPIAFVELKQDQYASEADIIAFAKKYLENYKVPVSITIMDHLPRTPNGKISRKELAHLTETIP